MFKYFEPKVIKEIYNAKSRITISFNRQGSKHEKISVLGVIIHFINDKYENVTRLIGLPELSSHRKTGVSQYTDCRLFLILIYIIDQCAVLLPLLTRFGITLSNLRYFVLNNATNNDTTLTELRKHIGFVPKDKRLRCIGHILNLITEAYLFGQDVSTFKDKYMTAGAPQRRALQRRRGELRKRHNLVAHVMASGKRIDVFIKLQADLNTSNATGKRQKLVLDRGIRWNASYKIIVRALDLREVLDTYATKLRVSADVLDTETFKYDYLSNDKQKSLGFIKDQLQLLFLLTKELEGNTEDRAGVCKASHRKL